eukprot:scaffold200228_cov58-Attheya_sp.AAC.1
MFTLPGMHNSPGIFAKEDRYRPIMIHIESISKEGQNIDSVHKCEYLSGSKGALAIADANNQYMYGIIPTIVNHIMSYTCLTQLKVEHQETGASTSTGIMSNVYESFVLLSKKHYTSRLFNGEMHDKGISYVRRTGSYLRNVAMRKFLKVLLETSDTNEILQRVQNEYRALKAAVQRGESRLMVVRTTDMGYTGDYVNICIRGSNQSTRVQASMFDPRTMYYDRKYYVAILMRCLEAIIGATGLPDATSLIAHTM